MPELCYKTRDELGINDATAPEIVVEKLFCAAILSEGVDASARILGRFNELRTLVAIEPARKGVELYTKCAKGADYICSCVGPDKSGTFWNACSNPDDCPHKIEPNTTKPSGITK